MPNKKKGKVDITKTFFEKNFTEKDYEIVDADAVATQVLEDINLEENDQNDQLMEEWAHLDPAMVTFKPSTRSLRSILAKASNSAATKAIKAAAKSPEKRVQKSRFEIEHNKQAVFDETPYKELVNDEELFNTAFAGVNGLRLSNNYYAGNNASNKKAATLAPGTMKRVFRELRDLAGFGKAGLVLSKDVSMFVRCDEEQPQYMRAAVTGVSDTPYAYGVFLFDIFLPSGAFSSSVF